MGGCIVSVGLAFSAQVFAQDDDDEYDDADDGAEEIVVTGSRLKRDTYSSISPLQIITGQVSREVGLIDGASSVYGSDAIDGVANVILRKDFDGLEIAAFTRVPEYSGGVENTHSLVWGKNFDRGFFGLGVEYTDSDRVTRAQRPWTQGCDKHHEIDENGQIRTEERFYNNVYGMNWDECRIGLLVQLAYRFRELVVLHTGFFERRLGRFLRVFNLRLWR